MDRKVKIEKYREAGVKEYWIVNSDTLEVMVNILTNGRYISKVCKDSVEFSQGEYYRLINLIDRLPRHSYIPFGTA